MSRIGKFIETGNKIVLLRGRVEKGGSGYKVSFRGELYAVNELYGM